METFSAENARERTVYTGCPIIVPNLLCAGVERIKPSRKVLYRFAIFAIVNEKLIKKGSANRSGGRSVIVTRGLVDLSLINFSLTIAKIAKW